MRPLSSDLKLSSDLNPPRIDSYRFSMANLEDSQDVDLDAILGELCALESQYDAALQATCIPTKTEPEVVHRRTMSDVSQTTGAVQRTDSPDNDSAFSDSVSLLSSESSASSGRNETHSQMENGGTDGKAEKIRLALQKMKEASVKKLFIKVFSGDGSAKSLMVDETMTCGYVTRVLADKNHQVVGPQWALMEHLPDLHLERVYEDHEQLVDNLMIWTRDSKNRLLFVKRPERTMLFEQPELLSGPNSMTRGDNVDECSRNNMIEELFSGSCVPSMEGPLYVKSDSKKGWKKHHCILRASGLYYLPKDKVKTSYKDLVCLATFDVNQVYYGVGWRKKYKAPTEFCFALKHPSLQQPKSCKFIKFLCAEDQQTMHQWVLAIRMAKHGRQLLVNYRSILEESRLPNPETTTLNHNLTNARHSTISATSSLLDTTSESGSSGCDVAFESDFPCGTIKRKPPKLPLTATTRQLKEIAVGNATKHIDRAPSFESLPPPPPEVLENFVHVDEDLPPPPPPPRLAPPSAAFLQDLQRVMRRKWQVAQKCKLDTTTTPHEVLGFRDPPDYKETNVSNWVNEHYGKQNLYENVYRQGGAIQIAPNIQIAPVKKRPPPPPPPRSETTQLTTRTPQKC
ncbi:amyloid beta A4 precursor protein-binding family B member 1-interacting protein-like isoform X1 [Macrosteles quadrilineatus]|nr:amyloid beta A4 precursor protein-binding family B member 1-interacting protein-like isoform X1 [Macrosteles quadrilineatus]XP_054271124.1 amyloid beta A4 precursor protein-binding family B member 1-interacting protein-like isoform X1 [Macrosteles quadrilineatus]